MTDQEAVVKLREALRELLDFGGPCDVCYKDHCDESECTCYCHRQTEKLHERANAAMAATAPAKTTEAGLSDVNRKVD